MLQRDVGRLAAALVIAALWGTLLATPISAHHLPAAGCSESGDSCYTARRVEGIRRLGVFLVEKYFDRYRLCVNGPENVDRCHGYRIREMGSSYGSSIRWRADFPFEGRGSYRVVWRLDGRRLATQGFHVR